MALHGTVMAKVEPSVNIELDKTLHIWPMNNCLLEVFLIKHDVHVNPLTARNTKNMGVESAPLLLFS